MHSYKFRNAESRNIFSLIAIQKELREKLIDPWYVKLEVIEIHIVFKIDTGAYMNVISLKTFGTLNKRPNLKPVHNIYKSQCFRAKRDLLSIRDIKTNHTHLRCM